MREIVRLGIAAGEDVLHGALRLGRILLGRGLHDDLENREKAAEGAPVISRGVGRVRGREHRCGAERRGQFPEPDRHSRLHRSPPVAV
ncbi:MAG: hypothetical protein M5U08_01460 [Burkholderiales bacterium]|nr:hypothetical protein [Burkholderiales bacterium]